MRDAAQAHGLLPNNRLTQLSLLPPLDSRLHTPSTLRGGQTPKVNLSLKIRELVLPGRRHEQAERRMTSRAPFL